MKQALVLVSLILSLNSLLPVTTHASHIAAVDLSLTCIGGNDYLVRFVLYRDCSGIPAENTVRLIFACTSNPAMNFTLNQVPQLPGTGQTIAPNCPQMPTKCSGGSMYGIQEFVYQAQVTLPACNYWRVSWTTCCRNPSNTITSASSQSAYIEANLDNLNAPCNSNPVFATKPATILYQGQTNVVNPGVVDPDGDSLTYALVTPFNSSNTTFVNWIAPYSATQPFPANPPMTLDPNTGVYTVTPTMNIISPMAIRVEEWRTINGTPVKIGTVYRDLQVNVVTSNNTLPVLGGMHFSPSGGYDPNDTIFDLTICMGDTADFYIHGFDADVFNVSAIGSPEKFSIAWNNGIPQAGFQIYYPQTDSAYAHFYWKPHPVHLAIPKRCFTVTVQDYACPYFGTNTYTYCILLKQAGWDLGPDTLLCRGESILLKGPSHVRPAIYNWLVNGTPAGLVIDDSTFLFNSSRAKPGFYTVKLELGNGNSNLCPSEVLVQVVYLPKPNLGNDTTLIASGSLTLDAGPGMMYFWNTGAMSQTISVSKTGLYKVLVDGGYYTRCTGEDTIFVQFPIGLEDAPLNPTVSLVPNPSGGILTLHFSEPCKSGTFLSVFNAAGVCVVDPTPVEAGALRKSLQLNHLPEGIYLVKINSGKEQTSHKIIISHL